MSNSKDNIAVYNRYAASFAATYDSITSESVHDWLSVLPVNGKVLDVGAGSGRDARYFASRGLDVVAVEPALELLSIAKKESTGFKIQWIQDELPCLSLVVRQAKTFDLILLSAVWMHLSHKERESSISVLSKLITKGGKLVITLRHGNFTDGRTTNLVNVSKLTNLAKNWGLHVCSITGQAPDKLGREDILWQTVVLGK